MKIRFSKLGGFSGKKRACQLQRHARPPKGNSRSRSSRQGKNCGGKTYSHAETSDWLSFALPAQSSLIDDTSGPPKNLRLCECSNTQELLWGKSFIKNRRIIKSMLKIQPFTPTLMNETQ